MASFTAQVAEVVHVERPSHGSQVPPGADEIHLNFERVLILIADPLAILVRERTLSDVVVTLVPAIGRIQQPGTNLQSQKLPISLNTVQLSKLTNGRAFVREREREREKKKYYIDLTIDLEISHESRGVGVGTRIAASDPLNDRSTQVVIIRISKRVRAPVEGRADDELVSRAAELFPQ